MSEVVRTLTPRFIESPEEFAAGYPILWPHITDLHITSAAYLPLIAQARPIGAMGLLYDDRRGFSTEGARRPVRAGQQHRAEPHAGHALRAGRRTSPRASSRPCCPAPSPASAAPTSRSATARRPSAGTSAATGTT